MTKEITSISPRQQKKLTEAVAVIKNVYDLTDEEIDAFFALCKHSVEFMELMQKIDKRVTKLEHAVSKEEEQRQNAEIFQMKEFLTKGPEVIKL